jgi:transposase
MRAGTEAALARVVTVFGAARPHHAYLFTNRRANRMKVLVHDGIGVWLAARRLNSGRFVWPKDVEGTLTLSRPQFDALVLGLPWQRIVCVRRTRLDDENGVQTDLVGCQWCGRRSAIRLAGCVGSRSRTSRM